MASSWRDRDKTTMEEKELIMMNLKDPDKRLNIQH